MSEVKNKIEDEFDLENYQFAENDFNLVQAQKKIFDAKFETKPTTYIKDALKRFKKNKSSVAGAFILGFLILCAIFVPIFSTAEIKESRTAERLLAPKLFASGTGFWDGCREVEYVVYDVDNQCPADYYAPAVTNLKVYPVTYINSANKYAVGGYFNFINEISNSTSEDMNSVKFLSSTATTFTSTGGYKVDVELLNENNVNEYQLGQYRVVLKYKADDGITTNYVVLKDWSNDYSKYSLDISSAMAAAGVTEINGTLTFELKAGNGVSSYILIKQCILTSTDGNENLAKISITDSTESVLYTKEEGTNVFPIGYWSCSGVKNIYKAELYYCDFSYDTYAGAYDTRMFSIPISTLEDYIEAGWCEYDTKVGPSSFKKLSDKCPIESISEQVENKIKVTNVVGKVAMYKYYGYNRMPIFLFGTDDSGHDIVKLSFNGLRTSLIIGVCTAAFCLMFGLCWGAISGYFGGNVDLFMERFCDILGGIPTLVIMTLCILHFGSNFITFFLALCLTGWMGTAGRTRTQFYRFKGREYVLASRTLGASDKRLIFKHILPNSLGTIVTSSVLMIPSVIFSEATLSYLNLLTVKNSFGVILSGNQQFIEHFPNLIVFPAVVLALMMISFNLFGNGLRDALNPSLKGSD